jgi:Uma2 family endonuclease
MLAAMSKPGGRRYTAEALAELERHEVVGGELVQKAQPSFRHGMTQSLLGGALARFQESNRGAERPGGAPCPGGWWIGSEIEVELAPDEVYLPDVAGWRVERMPEPFEARPVRIAPDWVCEILSPSTADRDIGHKQRVYHLARVRHYWVVEPAGRTLTVYRWQEAGYERVLTAVAGDMLRAEPFDTMDLELAGIFVRPQRER